MEFRFASSLLSLMHEIIMPENSMHIHSQGKKLLHKIDTKIFFREIYLLARVASRKFSCHNISTELSLTNLVQKKS